MRSGFYLDQEEINALKEKEKVIKETTLKNGYEQNYMIKLL